MMNLSACIELLFKAEEDDFVKRVYLAAEAGLPAVEFWGWRDKDIVGIHQALLATGLKLGSFLSEPRGCLTDPRTHGEFLRGLEESIEVAQHLGAAGLIVLSGDAIEKGRTEQRQAVVDALLQAAPLAEAAGITLLLEPLNTKVDHQGYFLDRTEEGLKILAAVGSPKVKLLYDMYHSIVMGEAPKEVLQGKVEHVGHVHIADMPGRHEPGTGTVDWRSNLGWLEEQGYRGYLGLEYWPSKPTLETLQDLKQLLAV
jgi:hydroxypyruvate isomerase